MPAARPMRSWIGIFSALLTLTTAAEEPRGYRLGAEGFVTDMVRRHGFDKDELAALLAQTSYSQEVIDAIRRPYEGKPWYKYRPIFLTDERIRDGTAFWRENSEVLARAQARYGVPPQIITAIIGVETNYGGNLGRHRVIDALSTLGFSYPQRAGFFRKELEQFVLLTRDESVNALRVSGSYAGAMGLPQFIPSSYRVYAVDFDGDGKRNLWDSTADAIGSVGNYFKRHGWNAGEPVAFEAKVEPGRPKGLASAGRKPMKPGISVARLRASGVTLSEPVSSSTRATLIRLDAPEPEYWLGFENFYVITRYNHSNLYAMAVHQLAREIEAAHGAEGG